MTLIGVLVIGGLGYSFISSAPDLSPTEYHKESAGNGNENCLQCHVQNIENAPIMPHRPMGNCFFCHRPSE